MQLSFLLLITESFCSFKPSIFSIVSAEHTLTLEECRTKAGAVLSRKDDVVFSVHMLFWCSVSGCRILNDFSVQHILSLSSHFGKIMSFTCIRNTKCNVTVLCPFCNIALYSANFYFYFLCFLNSTTLTFCVMFISARI